PTPPPFTEKPPVKPTLPPELSEPFQPTAPAPISKPPVAAPRPAITLKEAEERRRKMIESKIAAVETRQPKTDEAQAEKDAELARLRKRLAEMEGPKKPAGSTQPKTPVATEPAQPSPQAAETTERAGQNISQAMQRRAAVEQQTARQIEDAGAAIAAALGESNKPILNAFKTIADQTAHENRNLWAALDQVRSQVAARRV
ncbi:MAG: hypothetical protein ABIR24_04520, partial [Verrucomicrobiota bacterium]